MTATERETGRSIANDDVDVDMRCASCNSYYYDWSAQLPYHINAAAV
jgi:hypothetical protein